MRKNKYTLPRHTILATQGTRIGAFLIDVAVLVATSLVFFYGCFNLIFRNKIAPSREALTKEQLNSHLRIEVDGKVTQPTADAEHAFETYNDTLKYFYFNYFAGNDIDPEIASKDVDVPLYVKGEDGTVTEISKKDYITVDWYNKYVLGITNDNPDENSEIFFTYVKDGEGNYDKTQIGVPKADKALSDISYYMQRQYLVAYNNFLYTPSIMELSNEINFVYTLEFVLSAFLGSIITYIVIPFALKDGKSVGKLAFGLALANRNGYRFTSSKLFLRVIPFYVCLASLLAPIWGDLMMVFLVFLIIFLVSFAISMASPYRACLHDLTAGTIVINNKASIIFNNEIEEEHYLIHEDGFMPEEVKPQENDGEEPTISYEK